MPVAIDGRAAVDRVHAVGLEVVREPRRAADAGDEDDVLAAQSQIGQEALHGLEHGVVTAPGTPADLLVAGEVLAGLGASLGERRHRLDAAAHPGKGQVGGAHDVPLPSSRRSVGRARQVHLDAFGVGDQVADRLGELGRLQRQPADVVVADGVDQVARPHQHRELTEVHLGDQHLVVALEHVAEVARERVEVAQVHLRDVVAGRAHTAYAGADRAVRRPPAEDQDLRAPVGVVDLQRRERLRDPLHLRRARADHEVVVGGVVGDVPVAVALLEPADAVLQARRTRDRPRPRQRLLVAQVGPELGLLVGRA